MSLPKQSLPQRTHNDSYDLNYIQEPIDAYLN